MHKQYFQRLILIIAAIACSGFAWAETVTATFDFSSTQQLTQMGLAIPTSTVKTSITSPITVQGVTMTPSTSVVPQVTYYKNAYNLYLIKNAHVTLSAPTGSTITKVEFTALNSTVSLSASAGSLVGLTWTGSANSVKFTGTASNTIYTVSVTYDAESVVQTATGLGALRQLTDGSRVRLYLPDGNNCRVTYASEDGAEVYLRDNSGAVMLENIDTNRPFAPNQHIAGWITGKFSLKNGMPKLVADGSLTNTTQLVIADPVTETNVSATTITPPAYARSAANLVRLMNLTIKDGKAVYGSQEFTINNLYGMGKDEMYQTPYEGATVDLICLAVPTASGNTLVPVNVNNVPPVFYVVRENAPFVAPAANITNTAVRLTRDLTAGEWNTLVLPFDLDRFNGTLMQPTKLTDGKLTMTQASRLIEHNKPYLFKPVANGDNTTLFTDVTLYAGGPTTVQGMTGMYNNTFMDNITVTALAYRNGTPMLVEVPASQVKTSHAFFSNVATLDINGEGISLLGDVNLDGTTDVSDINCVINIIMESVAPGTYGTRDDVNGDGTVDVSDINELVNIIMGNSSSTTGVTLHVKSNNK